MSRAICPASGWKTASRCAPRVCRFAKAERLSRATRGAEDGGDRVGEVVDRWYSPTTSPKRHLEGKPPPVRRFQVPWSRSASLDGALAPVSSWRRRFHLLRPRPAPRLLPSPNRRRSCTRRRDEAQLDVQGVASLSVRPAPQVDLQLAQSCQRKMQARAPLAFGFVLGVSSHYAT
jgi:hypothetical protein